MYRLKEAAHTPAHQKNHPPQAARFDQLSLIRCAFPISCMVDERKKQPNLFDQELRIVLCYKKSSATPNDFNK
jgi:hypothetical protein